MGGITESVINANEIIIGNNTSTLGVNNLTIKNNGSGDATLFLSAGSFYFTIGIDRTNQTLSITPNATELSTTNAITLATNGVLIVGGTTPGGSTGLSLVSPTRFFVPSRGTSSQMEATSGISGAIYYNTTSGGLYLYVSQGVWRQITTQSF